MRYGFDLTCPVDGGVITHVAAGTTNGNETRAVARCQTCDTEYVIAVQLYRSANPVLDGDRTRPGIEHGTERGYQQHRRRPHDPACGPCREAHNAHTRGTRKKARRRMVAA